LIKSQPFTAKARLDKYVQSGLIGSQEGGRLGDAIQKAQYSTGARNISANTMAGADGKFGEGKVTPEQADLAISTVEGSGSWDPPHRMVTKGMYAGQYALGKFGVMQGNLQPWLKEAGMAPMSEAEFIQDHDAQTKLFRTRIMQYQEEGGSFNAAIRKWFTGSFNPAPGANDGGMTVEKYVANANAALARGADRSTVDRVSRQSAEEAAPGDHTFADIVSQHSEMQHSRDLQIQLDGERRNATTVASALLAGPDGKLPMSVEELRQDPKIAAAYDGMSLPDQIKVQNHLQANITKGGYAFTPQSKADYMGFVGAYNNPQRSPEDTDKLLNMDIMAQHWPTAEKKQALVMYGKLMDREAADPHMAYPLQVLDSMMAGAEIDTKRDSQGHHKDDYNQFVGALTEVYKDSMKENAQRPKENEIKVMGSRLIQDLTRYRRSIFQPIQKYYQMDVPDDVIESTKEAYRKAYNAEPSDTEIHSLAVATQYQRLYGRKPKASP
jgi:hypothetical protein